MSSDIFYLRTRKDLKATEILFANIELHDTAFSNAIVNLIRTCPQVDKL